MIWQLINTMNRVVIYPYLWLEDQLLWHTLSSRADASFLQILDFYFLAGKYLLSICFARNCGWFEDAEDKDMPSEAYNLLSNGKLSDEILNSKLFFLIFELFSLKLLLESSLNKDFYWKVLSVSFIYSCET